MESAAAMQRRELGSIERHRQEGRRHDNPAKIPPSWLPSLRYCDAIETG
jgi:hypothetical protein